MINFKTSWNTFSMQNHLKQITITVVNNKKYILRKLGCFKTFEVPTLMFDSLNFVIKCELFGVTVCKRSMRLFWNQQNWLNKITCCNFSNGRVVKAMDSQSNVEGLKSLGGFKVYSDFYPCEMDQMEQMNNRSSWRTSV